MNKLAQFFASIFLVIGFISNAQDIVWTGTASNNDFFDEGNWRNSITDLAPSNGSIDPGTAINLPLQINNVANLITANGIISLGTGTLVIGKATLTATSFSGGNVTINEDAYVELSSTAPLASNVQVNFTSGIGWVKTVNVSARSITINYSTQLKVNGANGTYKSNLRLDNYYLKGCVIRANLASTTPLMIYDDVTLQGTSAALTVNTIHKGAAIANAMNNKMESFILKKGFMVTIAIESDGTGKSKNFIATEADLVINELPKTLANRISFIRVMPWNWVAKKGRNTTATDLNTTWRYQWNGNEESGLSWEFAPMSWGHGTTTDSAIDGFINKYGCPYIMSFNEPDDCDGQSGQYGFPGSPKLCDVDEAVKLHKNFMKTGMRIVSPGGREEAPFGWLKEFHAKATAQDIRIDVIAVHWYDWSTAKTVPNPTAQQVFDRFKAYLTNVYNLYKLPIWITEFNANPARSQAVNAGFLELALPYLESLDYIERYCWFPFNTGTHFTTGWNEATRTETNQVLSLVGTIYRNINNTTPVASTPSVPEATFVGDNNLNLLQFPNIALNKVATANSTYSVDFPASMAVDGDSSSATSQWIGNFGLSGELNYAPLPAWFEVDLQGSFTIDSFRITESLKAVKNYSFEVWDATLNGGAGGWSSVFSTTNNPATPLTSFKTFNPVTTTKVRLYVNEHYSTSTMRLLEIEVYGFAAETLGTKKFEKQQPFTLYPNPTTNGILNIVGDQEVESVVVYDILGNKIDAPIEKGSISVSKLSSGIYFMKINNKYSIKFIKK